MISVSLDLAVFLFGTFADAFVTGLVGFAFGMVAAGVWLHALTPLQATTLIIAYALLVQGYAVWKLRRAIRLAWFRRIVLALLLISGTMLLTTGR